jgi:tRNA threonylcarbamoyl adenosine modification protein YeaZ
MISIGVDTSNGMAVFGAADDVNLLGEASIDLKGKFVRNLLPAIDDFLNSISISIKEIDLISVVLGPGSWTGIRVGVTTMKIIAQAMNKPIVGLCSLDVIAYNIRFSNYPVYTILDAARGNVYFAEYECSAKTPKCFSDCQLKSFEDFLSNIRLPAILIGTGVIKYQHKISPNILNKIILPPPFIHQTRGAFVVEAGFNRYNQGGDENALSLIPLYFQKSDAERAWEEKHSHNSG